MQHCGKEQKVITRHHRPSKKNETENKQQRNDSVQHGSEGTRHMSGPRTLNLLTEGQQRRYSRLQHMIPRGFQAVLEKIIKAVLVARPLHVYNFLADFVNSQLSHRTFDEIVYGCHLLNAGPRSTESCRLLHFLETRPADGDGFVGGPDAFVAGAVPEYEITAPALDRYRQLMGIGSLFENLAVTGNSYDQLPSYQQHECDSQVPYTSMKAHMPDFYCPIDSTKQDLINHPGSRLQTCGCAFCAALHATATAGYVDGELDVGVAQPFSPTTLTSMKAHMPDHVAAHEAGDAESEHLDIAATWFTMKAHMPDYVAQHEIAPDHKSGKLFTSNETQYSVGIAALPEPTGFVDESFTVFGDDEIYEECGVKSSGVFGTTQSQFEQVFKADEVFSQQIRPEPGVQFIAARGGAEAIVGELTDAYLDGYIAEALSKGDPAEHQQQGANTAGTLEILNIYSTDISTKSEIRQNTAVFDEDKQQNEKTAGIETVHYTSMKAHMPDTFASAVDVEEDGVGMGGDETVYFTSMKAHMPDTVAFD